MKHFTLAIAALLLSASAAMGANVLTNATAVDVKAVPVTKTVTANKTLNPTVVDHNKSAAMTFTLPKTAVAPAKAPAKRVTAADVTTWNSLGNIQFTDPMMPEWFDTTPFAAEVEIQEAEGYPGYFRLVNPYLPVKNKLDGSYTDTTQSPMYMYINAQDPNAVYIERFATGYTAVSKYGELILSSYAYRFLQSGYALDLIAANGLCGTYANGVITFPANTLLMAMSNYDNGTLYVIANTLFRVAFPDAKDFSIAVAADGCANGNNIAWEVTAGDDVATITYWLLQGDYDINDAYMQAAASIALQKGSIVPKAGVYKFDMSTATPGRYTLFVGAFDEDDNYVGGEGTFFYVLDTNDEGWEKVADADYGDIFIGSQYNQFGYTEFKVEVQEKTDAPGYYRIVNPYSTANFKGVAKNDHPTDHNHYIYIDATNPEAVILEEGPIGSNWGYGDMFVSSNAFRDGTNFGTLASQEYTKRITFPAESLLFSEQEYLHGYWFTCKSNDGDFFLDIPKIVIEDIDVVEDADEIVEMPDEITEDDEIELPSTSTIGTEITYSIENMVAAEPETDTEALSYKAAADAPVAELVSDATGTKLIIHKVGEFDLVAKMAGNDDYAPKTLTQHIVIDAITPSGINAVEADAIKAAAKYYNINGARVNNPAKGQVVITVSGKDAKKEIAK